MKAEEEEAGEAKRRHRAVESSSSSGTESTPVLLMPHRGHSKEREESRQSRPQGRGRGEVTGGSALLGSP